MEYMAFGRVEKSLNEKNWLCRPEKIERQWAALFFTEKDVLNKMFKKFKKFQKYC